MTIRTSAAALAFAVCLATPAAADFPERPSNLVAPFNAGGGTDLLLRGFAPHFEEAIGAPVFVSNMSGGSGTVAASALSGQRPTGYQMAYMSITVSTIQPQIKNVPYGVDSWTPICSVAASPTLLFVNNDSPFQLKHLPFRGAGPAIKELTAGNIQFFGDTEVLMQRGDFRPLMVFNNERLENYPDVPTAAHTASLSDKAVC